MAKPKDESQTMSEPTMSIASLQTGEFGKEISAHVKMIFLKLGH
ncbi:hypothetical protein [Bradyrhizobium neotropicale]|nr:hypothetical protein [Bradyrhizobium neotropicale]